MPVTAPPAGAAVAANPSIGRVLVQPVTPRSATLGITLLATPATQPVSVTVTTNDSSVATVNGGSKTTLVLDPGDGVLQLPIETSGKEGAALITLEFGNERRELLIVVGRSEERRVGKECRSRWSP